MELTAELLAGAAELLDTVISPNGSLVAYVVGTADDSSARDRLRALWVAPADGSSAPRRLAAGPELAGVPRWAADSASLVFISGGQLHRIGLDGGEPEPLTSWRGEIARHLPLADGRVAVIATDEPDAEREHRRAEGDDAIVWTRWGPDVPRNRLHLLDLGARDLTLAGALGDRHVLEVAQRPDGGPLAVLSWACPADEPGAFTAELHVVDPDTGKASALGPAGLDARSPAWWHDGGRWHLAYLAVTPPGLVGGTAVFDVPVGTQEEHRNLTAGLDVCPTDLAQVAVGPPLALFADGLDTALYRLDPGTHRFGRVLVWPGGRPTGSHSTGCSSCRPAGAGPTARSPWLRWYTAGPTAGTPTHSSATGGRLGSGWRPRATRSSCPTRGADRAWTPVRGHGLMRGRHRRVDRHPGRDRRPDRRRRRRPGPARDRRVEPRRLHGRVGGGPDRPLQGRADGGRDLRLGHAGRRG